MLVHSYTFDTILCHNSAFFEQRGLDKLTVDNCIVLLCWEHGNIHISTALFKKINVVESCIFFFIRRLLGCSQRG